MDSRTDVFRKLKPACIAVSQLALRQTAQNTEYKKLVDSLETLYSVLLPLEGLDEKLADYVFFPLSYIFRDAKTSPSNVVEKALRCLHILIKNGWRQKMSVEHYKQLLTLLGFFAERYKSAQDANELTLIATLQCIVALFEYASPVLSAFSKAGETESLPLLGHTITIILEALTDSTSTEVQLLAVQALCDLLSCLDNAELLRNFLPGILSSLTKVLQPVVRSRRPYRVLVKSLDSANLIILGTLSNSLVLGLSDDVKEKTTSSKAPESSVDGSWVKASARQVKLALASIVGLRKNSRTEVLEALFRLCKGVLEDCSEALSDASILMLETMISICSHDPENTQIKNQVEAIQQLISVRRDLLDDLMSITFDLIKALTTVLLSADDTRHHRHIANIRTAYGIISSVNLDASMLQNGLAAALQESTITLMKSSPEIPIQTMQDQQSNLTAKLDTTLTTVTSMKFSPLPVTAPKQSEALQEIFSLLNTLNSNTRISILTRQLTTGLATTTGNKRLAYLMLSSRTFQEIARDAVQFDEFMQYSSAPNELHQQFMEPIYAKCIDILSAPSIDDDSDWRVQALALEIVAMQAMYEGPTFRPELVDALYPVLERIGSNNTMLREHAMTCLNMLAQSCNYQSASDLVLQNADYLVNSLALKFNTFEISPQAPQVLAMMIRLCGSQIIPKLDDLLDSIFSVLASFHGYQSVTEALFSVLRVVVEEGSTSSKLQIEGAAPNHRKSRPPRLNLKDVEEALKQPKFWPQKVEELPSDEPVENLHTPHRPWGEFENSDKDSEQPESMELDKPVPPPSKVYTIVQSILRLSQNYLTHSSPILRTNLLSLISTGTLALSQNEDLFLPLINDIWPVVIKRLYDPEPFVCIAAAETLGRIFQAAGDFVSSRVSNEWEHICALYRQTYAKMQGENKGKRGRGQFSPSAKVWEALVSMFVELVTFVRIDAEMEGELIDMMEPLFGTREDVKAALEVFNRDAVWLCLERQRRKQGGRGRDVPGLEGFTFKAVTV